MSWVVTIHEEFENEEEARAWADFHELTEVASVQESVAHESPADVAEEEV